MNVFVLGVDLDECTAGLKSCPETGSVCSDPDLSTNGTAICVCATGYTGNGTSCENIDECMIDGICPGEGFQCENTAGSFLCFCKRNYELVNGTCVHDNDCTKRTICHENADCITVNGTFNCRCKSGYTGDGENNCTDINECEGQNECHSNATCENVPGSYECTCKVKVENGVSCQVSSYCPTPAPQDNSKDDCKNDDDDDDTVIVLVSITIILLVLCLIALIVAIWSVYRMKMYQ